MKRAPDVQMKYKLQQCRVRLTASNLHN